MGIAARTSVAVFALAAQACSSQSGVSSTPEGSLDCAYVMSADSCWKSTAAAAARCLPPPGEQGTMSADGKTCTYASGAVVAFDNPLTASGSIGPWSFTVTTGGTTCLRLAQPAPDQQTLTTSLGTLSEVVDGGPQGDLTFTCPDGTTLSGPESSISSCKNAWPSVGIGTSGLSRPDAAPTWLTTFSLENTGASSDVIVFRCGN
jgi:hypothetical protein